MTPPLYLPGDTVWLRSYFRKKGVNPKLSAKYVGPYVIREVLSLHTYRVEKDGKSSVQHEAMIRLHVEGRRTHRINKPDSRDALLPSPRLHQERASYRTLPASQQHAVSVTLPRPRPQIDAAAPRSAPITIPLEAPAPEASRIPEPVPQDQPEPRPPSPVARVDSPTCVPSDPAIPPLRRSLRLQEKRARECQNNL